MVITIYGLINYYIFQRALQAIPSGTSWRSLFIIIFWVQAGSFVLARFLERAYPCTFTEVVTWIGSLWMGAMLYFFLAIVIIDFSRLLNAIFHLYPSFFFTDYQRTKLVVLFVTIGFVFALTLAGFINARLPRVKELKLRVAKSVPGDTTLRIVMVSDIHLGTLIAKRRANALTEKINSLHPDIVLFAGDVVDEDLKPVIRRNLGEHFTKIRSKLGVFAIPGNHEYIGGAPDAIRYMRDHGITVLQDTAILVDQRFYLAGRDDRDKGRFSGKERKSLPEIIAMTEPALPIILMDHQPFRLDESEKLGVDLHLSGHTHHGQLWPLNYMTKAIYEVSWGYKKKGNTHVYVSSGFGSWGPPMRLGNRPEIVVINLTFLKQNEKETP